MDNDPFLQVQDEVLSQLKDAKAHFQSYLRIRSSASSATSPELIEARNELQNVLRELQTDVEDLIESVKAVESDPYSFGLELEEVQRRRKLVDQVGNEVIKMHNSLKENAARQSSYLPDPSNFDEDDDEDYAAEYEQQRQQEILQAQDQELDGVFHTIKTINQQAGVMGQELEEQGQMLEEVEVLTDRLGGKLAFGLRKVGQVIKQGEDKWSSCAIGLLIAILIVLLILLILI